MHEFSVNIAAFFANFDVFDRTLNDRNRVLVPQDVGRILAHVHTSE